MILHFRKDMGLFSITVFDKKYNAYEYKPIEIWYDNMVDVDIDKKELCIWCCSSPNEITKEDVSNCFKEKLNIDLVTNSYNKGNDLSLDVFSFYNLKYVDCEIMPDEKDSEYVKYWISLRFKYKSSEYFPNSAERNSPHDLLYKYISFEPDKYEIYHDNY